MSELIVTPVTISDIQPHPYADKLELCRANGWIIVSGKGNYKVGDIVVHIPPDAMVPRHWAEKWEVTKYLSFVGDSDVGRVRAAKLREIVSFGFLVPHVDFAGKIGENLASQYGITKYDPPLPSGMSDGQLRSEHPLFAHYTDIQNLRNFPDKLNYGQPMVVLEKIHGTNSRIGWVRHIDPENSGMFELIVGSHSSQRDTENCGLYGIPLIKYKEAFDKLFDWFIETTGNPITLESIIIYGEIYGAGVQDLHYGAKKEKEYRIFDIAINGRYMHWTALEQVCQMFGLPTVPVIARGVIKYEELLELAQGTTTLADNHMKEGIVVRPMCEEMTWQKDELEAPRRMIFKLFSDAYMIRKGGTEYH